MEHTLRCVRGWVFLVYVIIMGRYLEKIIQFYQDDHALQFAFGQIVAQFKLVGDAKLFIHRGKRALDGTGSQPEPFRDGFVLHAVRGQRG